MNQNVQIDPQREQRRQGPKGGEREKGRKGEGEKGRLLFSLSPFLPFSPSPLLPFRQHPRPHQHEQRHGQEQKRNHHRLQNESQAGDHHDEQNGRGPRPAEAIAWPDRQQYRRQGHDTQCLEQHRSHAGLLVQAIEDIEDPGIEPGMIDPRDGVRARILVRRRDGFGRISEGIDAELILSLLQHSAGRQVHPQVRVAGGEGAEQKGQNENQYDVSPIRLVQVGPEPTAENHVAGGRGRRRRGRGSLRGRDLRSRARGDGRGGRRFFRLGRNDAVRYGLRGRAGRTGLVGFRCRRFIGHWVVGHGKVPVSKWSGASGQGPERMGWQTQWPFIEGRSSPPRCQQLSGFWRAPRVSGGSASPPRLTPPAYAPTPPAYAPTPPAYAPTPPAYAPTPPAYAPTPPAYAPTPPAYAGGSPTLVLQFAPAASPVKIILSWQPSALAQHEERPKCGVVCPPRSPGSAFLARSAC